MTLTFPSENDLRELLAERAEAVRQPLGLVPLVVASAARIRRRRRRAAALSFFVTGIVTLASVTQLQRGEEVGPTEPTPTVSDSPLTVGGATVWSDTLPGLGLPTGEPLRVPYGLGSSVFVGGEEHVLPGASDRPITSGAQHVVQVIETPLGVVTVTKLGGDPVFNLRLLRGDDVRDIGSAVQLSGLAAVGTGPDGRVHIAYAVHESDHEVYEGPLVDPQPLPVDGNRRQAVGFVNGDPLFSPNERPGTLEELRSDGAGGVGVEHHEADAPVAEGAILAGWTTLDAGALAVYTDVASGCTSAYRLPGSGAEVWTACNDDDHAPIVIGPRSGAVGRSVYDLVSGALVTTFEIPQAAGFDVSAIGWESSTDVILRVVSYEPYEVDGTADGATVPPRYVAIRCAVDTGACERLPHPVDVVPSNVGMVLPPS